MRFLFAEALIAIFHRDSRNRIRGRGLKIAGKANRIRRRPGQTVWIPRRREERGRRREKVPEKCRESISRSFFFCLTTGRLWSRGALAIPAAAAGLSGRRSILRSPMLTLARLAFAPRASSRRARREPGSGSGPRSSPRREKAKPSLLPPREAAPGATWSSLETGVTYGDRSTRMTRAQIRAGRRARRAVDARVHTDDGGITGMVRRRLRTEEVAEEEKHNTIIVTN